MSRVAIVGANKSIAVLIDKAKERGYETHVFARPCGDVGERKADYFYPIDVRDKGLIFEKCRTIGIDGICSITSDIVVPTVNYVGRQLGLTCNPEIVDTVARNKFRMRQTLRECGVYTPLFWLEGKDELNISRYIGKYPLIVKPTDMWSSKGVTRVENGNDLSDAVKRAVNLSLEHKAIVEDFIDGDEYSAECMCYRGKVDIIALTKKATTGFPNYIETGHSQPVRLERELKNRIDDVIKKAVVALGIQNGAAHAEFKITPNGEIAIIEIGARMGGDCIGTVLTPQSTGYDYVGMVLDVACGKRPDFSIVNERHDIGIRYIISKDDVKTYNIYKEDEAIEIVKAEIDDKNLTDKVEDSSSRHGYYIFRRKND